MKRVLVVLAVLVLLASLSAVAQTVLVNDAFSTIGSWQAASGEWLIKSGALVQNDVKALMAKADRPAAQSGTLQYEFTVNYVNGGYASTADLQKGYFHGGFGIHIGVDKPSTRLSWGNGKSYLLWINLDTRPETKAKYPQHYGLRAQVYRSESNSKMELLASYEIPMSVIPSNWAEYIQFSLPVKFVVNTRTGQVKVYDPLVPNYVYNFTLPGTLTGSYVSFRTNSLAAQFDNFKLTKLQ
jgi:hypothetical protein